MRIIVVSLKRCFSQWLRLDGRSIISKISRRSNIFGTYYPSGFLFFSLHLHMGFASKMEYFHIFSKWNVSPIKLSACWQIVHVLTFHLYFFLVNLTKKKYFSDKIVNTLGLIFFWDFFLWFFFRIGYVFFSLLIFFPKSLFSLVIV